jgi:AraC-like DNA-binding protein
VGVHLEELTREMDYREYRPAPPLARFVECFWFLTADDARGAPAEQVLPDGCMELIVHFGDPFRRFTEAGEAETQPASFLVGEMTRPLVVQPARRVGTMGIRFRPGGAFPVIGVDLDELTDRAVPLDALWGKAARDLEDGLREARSHHERIAAVERFLIRRLRRGRRDLAVEAAVGAILKSRGRGRMRSLSSRVGLGPRQLERRFLSAVGLRPKLFSRIVRFQNLVRVTRSAEPARWASAAAECGYFDQAHLVRDVRDFAGVPPSGLFREAGGFSEHFVSEARFAALFDDGFFQDPGAFRA